MNKNGWYDITGIQEVMQDGDIICSAKADPGKASKRKVFTDIDQLLATTAGIRLNCFTYQLSDWTFAKLPEQIIFRIQKKMKVKFPLKAWRKYAPKKLPMNETFCQPLPLP